MHYTELNKILENCNLNPKYTIYTQLYNPYYVNIQFDLGKSAANIQSIYHVNIQFDLSKSAKNNVYNLYHIL